MRMMRMMTMMDDADDGDKDDQDNNNNGACNDGDEVSDDVLTHHQCITRPFTQAAESNYAICRLATLYYRLITQYCGLTTQYFMDRFVLVLELR